MNFYVFSITVMT